MTKTTWTMIHIFSIGSFILLMVGFFLSISDILYPPKNLSLSKNITSPSSEKKEPFLLSLGDSLTRGVGDEKGKGYVEIVRKALQKRSNKKIQHSNLAINGQTSTDLLQQLQQAHVQELIKKSQWITMTIGGNDLNKGSGGFVDFNKKKAKKSRQTYEQNLKQTLTLIRKYNKDVPIFLFSLYNPYSDLPDDELSSKIVRSWNSSIHQVASHFEKVIIVPTFDLFQLNASKYLYSDHFHPNNLGYKRMATRLLQVMKDSIEGAKQKKHG